MTNLSSPRAARTGPTSFRPRPARRIFRALGLAAAALALFFTGGPAPALGQARSVPLQSIELELFAPLAPAAQPEIKASFKEKKFPLQEAANLGDMRRLIGPLTEDQKSFLEENRFLLLPKPKFMFVRPPQGFAADEMLANFDGLGGGLKESARRPENARFVGPDVILHAFHLYASSRLEAAEAGPLRRATRFMLAGLLDNAERLKKESKLAARDWERLMAQLTVPLVLLENCLEPGEEEEGRPDTLERALNIFDRHRPKFSPDMVRNIRGELRRVYRAASREESLLGLRPTSGGAVVDYARFKPEGHYGRLSAARAYFRAMVWLRELGWDCFSDQGVADALNFALAMSYAASGAPSAGSGAAAEDGERPAAAPRSLEAPADIRAAWARVVEVNAFFLGAPEGYSYQQWLALLMKEAEVPEFTADTSADPGVIKRLKYAEINNASGYAGPAAKHRIVTVFPRPALFGPTVAAYLSRGQGGGEKPPDMFSALWLSAMWGNRSAAEMLPRQAALAVSGAGQSPAEAEVKAEVEALNARMKSMARWTFSSEADGLYCLPMAALRLTRALSADFGSGYPLYMSSRAFEVKRIESVTSFFAEMAHDTPSLDRPLPVAPQPATQAAAEEAAPEKPPVVKGFVEPDLAFWAEMSTLAAQLEAGYRRYGLFPEDLESLGALSRFAKRLERCRGLAEKELQGQDLSEDDYEFIRLFSLDWMALPPGDPDGRRPPGALRSAVVSPVLTVAARAEGGQSAIIYEATAEPWLMLVLVGNEKSPRLALGLAYSHYEFAGPESRPITDEAWRKVVYGRYGQGAQPDGLRLPAKNFWYESILPPGQNQAAE